MKKPVPVLTGGKRPIPTVITKAARRDTGLTVDNDCICHTMSPHCPIHSWETRRIPAPGQDVIR